MSIGGEDGLDKKRDDVHDEGEMSSDDWGRSTAGQERGAYGVLNQRESLRAAARHGRLFERPILPTGFGTRGALYLEVRPGQ